MDMMWFVNEIKMELGCGVLKLELRDEQIAAIVISAMQECQKYSNDHCFVTIPYARCIDLTGFKSKGVINVYRAEGFGGENVGMSEGGISSMDPTYAQQWTFFSGNGLVYNLSNYIQNYAAYSTLMQIRNTMSTDMSFIEDPKEQKLYINCNQSQPKMVTIEYIPVWEKVEDVTEDFWVDIIRRMSIARTKIILGRIRSKYTQSAGGLVNLDGETLLSEGNEEVKALRERMLNNAACMNVSSD